ncbi:MAG TPA: cytochrome c3 family protein [Steroidobacter sp.]|nr:cytochrome c3 family protein [Steroidobacter sp.]
MAQIFDRGLVLALKVGAAIAAVLIVTLLFAWRWSINYPHALGAAPQQPLPFSHRHHVRDDAIDCRYCHTSVEKAASAGMPATEVCMTCHSQLFSDVGMLRPLRDSMNTGQRLRWTRVHDLPDFVYFDHSAHVTHGVPCRECHGRVDEMPLTFRVQSLEMQWCLSCHRDPGPHLVPPSEVFSMQPRATISRNEASELVAFYGVMNTRALTDCSICHR